MAPIAQPIVSSLSSTAKTETASATRVHSGAVLSAAFRSVPFNRGVRPSATGALRDPRLGGITRAVHQTSCGDRAEHCAVTFLRRVIPFCARGSRAPWVALTANSSWGNHCCLSGARGADEASFLRAANGALSAGSRPPPRGCKTPRLSLGRTRFAFTSFFPMSKVGKLTSRPSAVL